MADSILRKLTMDVLLNSSSDETLSEAFNIYARIQEEAAALADCQGEGKLTSIKVGTILAFAVIKRMLEGKNPKSFTKEEWSAIAGEVSEYAVKMDNQQYTEFVFLLYAEYIEFSVKVNKVVLGKETSDAVLALADELRKKTDQLQNGSLKETDYVEECLWISLEAIIKLLSVSLSRVAGKTASDLAQAVTAYAFEYGRLCLYKKQQALLEQYIANQYQLDAELQAQFEEFSKELREKEEQFRGYIDHAFEPGFRYDLTSSIQLAVAAGVRQEEILESVEEIDDFFLN